MPEKLNQDPVHVAGLVSRRALLPPDHQHDGDCDQGGGGDP